MPNDPHPTAVHGVSRGAWLALYMACAAVLITNAGRYLPPAGERFVDLLTPGSADLIPSVNAAHALMHGQNPYHASNLLVPDPYDWSRGSNEGFTYLYPPSHALVYAPLTLLSGGHFQVAQRLQFAIEIVCLGLLAWAVLALAGAIVPLTAAVPLALFPIVFLVLTLNPGNQLGLERGQSDVITSALAWGSVLAFHRRRWAGAAFLCVAAALLKGYGAALAAGLLLLGLKHDWRRTLAGAGVALVLLFVPVARYLPDALAALSIRSSMFWSSWNNQSFANLAFTLGLPYQAGRVVLSLAALGCAVLAWLRLARCGDDESHSERRALWASAFATTALMAVLGFSANCIAYACIIVMPGALILALAQEQLLIEPSLRMRRVLAGVFAVSIGAMFVYDTGLAFGAGRTRVPLSAAAQVVIMVVIATAAVRELRRR
jgi:Glycosyltransferase family 87